MQNDPVTSDRDVAPSFGLGAFFIIRHLDFVIIAAGFLMSPAAFASPLQRITSAFPLAHLTTHWLRRNFSLSRS